MKTPLLFAACLLAAGAAHAQTPTAQRLDEVLTGKNVPLSVLGKDLTPQYRRLVIGSSNQMADWQATWMGAKAGVEFGLYFSTGATLTSGGETYLVAYRPQTQIDPMIFNRGHGHGDDGDGTDTPRGPQKLRPNTPLALSLLNLKTTPSFNDIRLFDAAKDLESPAETGAASVRNLQQLGRGIRTYLNGRGGGKMPEIGATVTPALKRAFYPFVHDQRLWNHPATDELYLPNPALSKQSIYQIRNRAYVIAFYEPATSADGLRAVLFLDGHVERVAAERFERLQKIKPSSKMGKPESADDVDEIESMEMEVEN